MKGILRASWAGYAVALLAVAAALALRGVLDPLVGRGAATTTIYGAIAIAVWFGGFGPGLLAAVAGYLASNWFFIEPRGSISIDNPRELGQLIGYGFSAALIIGLGGAMHAARRRAEAAAGALATSEERFRAFMQHTPDSVLMKDEAGRYVFLNSAAEKLVGAHGEAWRGRTDLELLPEPVARVIRRRDEEVLGADAPRSYDLTLPGDGAQGERHIRSTKFPLRDNTGRRFIGSISSDVTEKKRAERALEEARQQLLTVTDTMSAAVTRCSRDLRYLWASRQYAQWLGLSQDQVTGKPIRDVIGEQALSEIHPYIERVLAGETVRYEASVQFSGIGARWISAAYAPTRDARGAIDGWVALVNDIEERKRSEEALRQAQERLRIIMDTVPAAIVWTDRDLRLRWANANYARWFGLAPERLPGMPIGQLVGPQGMAAIKPYVERVLRGEQVHYERLADLPALGGRWIASVFTPTLDEDGKIDGWVAIASDIHDRKIAEEALREADRRKDEFLAILAHELRNPLAPIRNSVAILARKGAADPELAWSRGVIERQVAQMTRLIDDLLDIERISRGKLLLRKELVALERVVDLAMETARPHLNAAGHRVSVVLPSEPVTLDADPARLAQVFSNLLINAAKYTEPGGAISVSAEVEGGNAVVSVEDNGIGFGPELASQLFKPFSQLAAGAARSVGGLGIGLSLVQGLVALHAGSVAAHSDGAGRGSRFSVTLPLAGRDELLGASKKPRPGETASAGVPILVADDNKDAADSLSRLLQIYGHRVRVAYDGAAALELAEEAKPRVAVLDIGMPGINGYDVARDVRARYGKDVLLIALTGWGQEADRRRSREAGFDYHLTKPVEPNELVELIAQLAK
ncbi:MAG TPA: PAS domain-containing protein [Burkholderiales bacterium]|nr:PAS domain-containing protein [Burkholderiales bacterium]